MEILHINSYYSCSSFYKNLYDKQKDNGLDIDVYVPVPEAYNTENLNLGEYTVISKNHGKYERLIFHIKHRKIYNDIVKTYDISKFSLLHAHSLFSNGYIAYKLKKEYNIPYIVAVRSTDVNLFFKYMIGLRKLGIEIMKEADKAIFLSKTYRAFVIEKYIPNKLKKEIFNKSEIIPNGVDDFWLQNKGMPKTLSEQKKINVLTVGDLSKRKNQLTTIKTTKLLQEKGYKIKYTVVGKIKNKKIYQQIKHEPYVQYIPYTPKEKLLDIYRKNDIFIMPSLTETFGLVYAEAMSQGLPVIYTRGQGFDGHFNEGEIGYSVNCMDEKDILEKILGIVNNYNVISKNAISRVDKFNWNLICDKYDDIYKNTVRGVVDK
jgi:glycosyltransferase involved in cell wall biosynthesis